MGDRLGILITLILAQVVLIIGVTGQFPSSSQLKLADIYLIVNFLFNVGALVESIIAAKLSECQCYCFRRQDEFSGSQIQTTTTSSWVDIASRIIFPVTFIMWNVAFVWYVNKCLGINPWTVRCTNPLCLIYDDYE